MSGMLAGLLVNNTGCGFIKTAAFGPIGEVINTVTWWEIPVRDLGCAPWIMLSPDDDLRTCAQMLVEHDLDAIPVLDADRRILGLVTVRAATRAAADAAEHEHPCWEE